MYSLPYFKEKDPEVIINFMQQNPFVVLCGSDQQGRAVATHVPVLIERNDHQLILRGHFMKNTDHHLAFTKNPEALAIFVGPHTYVSASWYSNPKQASTWNYLTVHARGKLSFLDDQQLMQILRDTTEKFEDNAQSPAGFDQLPKDYVERLSKAIVAFEINIEQLDNVFKLSQNRDRESYHTIMDQLNQKDSDARRIAAEMERREQELYDKTVNQNE
jgi:transcriptional regulator